MPKEKQTIPVNLGDHVELRVETLASSGDGLCRHEGYTLFVPTGLPGDVARCEIVKTTPRFGVARAVEFSEKSADRVTAPCPVFPECGGCKLQHLDYGQQMAFKVQVVTDALERIGKIGISVPIESVPAERTLHYRNKGSFALSHKGGKPRIGFYKQGTHEVVDSATCDTLLEPVNTIKEWVRGLMQQHRLSIYHEKNHKGLVRGLVVRHSPETGQSLLAFVTTTGEFPQKFTEQLLNRKSLIDLGIVGVVRNINNHKTNAILGDTTKTLWGQDFLTDRLGDLEFQLSLTSFFQVNPFQTVKLYDIIKEWVLQKPGPVVDAYCGNGGISLWLAKSGVGVTGVEESAESVADAKQSAQRNDLPNCRFVQGTLERFLADPESIGPAQTLIVDPPRKGCSEEVIDAIPQLKVERLIYVSCNPATLARDLARLSDYAIRAIKVIDMFPQTAHVETAVLLERTLSP
ncbi:MAG: 23S rRNA (uracil(1939)-C(5))-methyltransferase RlmD [Nitrospinae bacterium]|nr:23S rRNA (uracil(1939)-C(5))-methyltransferase RlmD [Nitrospinota bacterium]